MDPQACLRRFLAGDYADAARDYNEWVAKGGFRGVVVFDGLRREVHTLVATTRRLGMIGLPDATIATRAYADMHRDRIKVP